MHPTSGTDLRVTNVHSGDVGFKIMTTRPARYVVSRKVGMIAPGDTVSIKSALASCSVARAIGRFLDSGHLQPHRNTHAHTHVYMHTHAHVQIGSTHTQTHTHCGKDNTTREKCFVQFTPSHDRRPLTMSLGIWSRQSTCVAHLPSTAHRTCRGLH